MKTIVLRRTLALLLALLLAAALAPAALAEEAERADKADDEEERVLDAAELDKLIGDYLDANRRNPDLISVAYTSLDTGETYVFNPDLWCYPASIFKVPEMMLITNDVATGKLEADGTVCGCPLPTAMELILVRSQTEIAVTLFNYLGGQGEYRRRSVELAGWDESRMPKGWANTAAGSILTRIPAWTAGCA